MSRLTTQILDVSDGSLFGGPLAAPGAVTVAITDLTYDGHDNTEALRKRALRRTGGTRSRVLRRWRWYDAPAVTFLIQDPDRERAFR